MSFAQLSFPAAIVSDMPEIQRGRGEQAGYFGQFCQQIWTNATGSPIQTATRFSWPQASSFGLVCSALQPVDKPAPCQAASQPLPRKPCSTDKLVSRYTAAQRLARP